MKRLTRKLASSLPEPELPDGYSSWQEKITEQIFLREAVERILPTIKDFSAPTKKYKYQLVLIWHFGLYDNHPIGSDWEKIGIILQVTREYALALYYSGIRDSHWQALLPFSFTL